jgi:glutaredoxin 3
MALMNILCYFIDMPNVKIYTSPGCVYCLLAKNLLKSLNAEYEEINAWDAPDEADKLQREHSWSSLPMIVVNGEFLGGYDDINALHQEGKLIPKLFPAT